MSSANGDKAAADFCAELVRAHDFARYASTLFVPAEQRRGLLAIYAFNVEISRVREQVSQPLPGEVRLQWWTDMLAGAGYGGIQGHPAAPGLKLALRGWRFPVARLGGRHAERQVDLSHDPMPTLGAVR